MKPFGVLGFQGSVEEHEQMMHSLGCSTLRVKQASELETISGLIIPGGESTTFLKLLQSTGLYEPLKEKIKNGLPVLATCAGIIILAEKVDRENQLSMGLLRISVQRNGYGPQYDSFCEEVAIESFTETFRAVFIRAPLIQSVDPEVKILARDKADHPVWVVDRNVWGLTFHPELTQDTRIHQMFINAICK